MGIGVTSHSSSIEEAQADRVRRRAERDGLKRTHPPEEPAPGPGSTEATPAQAPAVAAATVVSSGGRAGTDGTHTYQSGRGAGGTTLAPPPGVVSTGTEPGLHDRQPGRGAHSDGVPGQTAAPSLGGGASAGVEHAAGGPPSARPVPPPPGLRTPSSGGQPARPAAVPESAGTHAGTPSPGQREAARLGSHVPQARAATSASPAPAASSTGAPVPTRSHAPTGTPPSTGAPTSRASFAGRPRPGPQFSQGARKSARPARPGRPPRPGQPQANPGQANPGQANQAQPSGPTQATQAHVAPTQGAHAPVTPRDVGPTQAAQTPVAPRDAAPTQGAQAHGAPTPEHLHPEHPHRGRQARPKRERTAAPCRP